MIETCLEPRVSTAPAGDRRGHPLYWRGSRGRPGLTHWSPGMTDRPADITLLLRSASSGDRANLDRLMAAIYDDLRRLAVSHLQGERDGHTLQPTALVHEAYLKLVDQRSTDWKDRLHFFAIASRIIRRILTDHARERHALKRGGGSERLSIDAVDPPAPEPGIDLVALDQALEELAQIDERQAKVVELRFFGGCTIDEISELLGAGRRTIDRDWMAARAWLYCRLDGQSADGAPDDGQ